MGCQIVQYAPMTERKVIKGDAVFENFRRYLADQVTVAINSGKDVSTDVANDYCPLGVLPGVGVRRPCGAQARRNKVVELLPSLAPSEFYFGFDGLPSFPSEYNKPYYELGKLYREMFIERK